MTQKNGVTNQHEALERSVDDAAKVAETSSNPSQFEAKIMQVAAKLADRRAKEITAAQPRKAA